MKRVHAAQLIDGLASAGDAVLTGPALVIAHQPQMVQQVNRATGISGERLSIKDAMAIVCALVEQLTSIRERDRVTTRRCAVRRDPLGYGFHHFDCCLLHD